jgi:hypothetical protein
VRLDALREVEDGAFYDASTGRLYNSQGQAYGSYTFENVISTSFWGMFWTRLLNPMGFATDTTAEEILRWARGVVPAGGPTVHRFDDTSAMSGWTRRNVPERLIVVTRGELSESYSAGRLAVSVAKHGAAAAAASWLAELRFARLLAA